MVPIIIMCTNVIMVEQPIVIIPHSCVADSLHSIQRSVD